VTVADETARRILLRCGFGLDPLTEIGVSTVVIWELSGTGEARQHRPHAPTRPQRTPQRPAAMIVGKRHGRMARHIRNATFTLVGRRSWP
jgi:hypothetical protein